MREVDDLYSEEEKYFNYTKQLKSITAKTLVVVGEKDWICPPGLLCHYCVLSYLLILVQTTREL